MNTPGLRDSVVMQVLSDFYWTAAMSAGLFTSNIATQQRHAEYCLQAARAPEHQKNIFGLLTFLKTKSASFSLLA